jgi:hypothetical protein
MGGKTRGLLPVLVVGVALVACDGGNPSSGLMPGATPFTVGGSLSGLGQGKRVSLRMNNADAITLSANGAFSFPDQLQDGFVYQVTALIQPLGETCAVINGSGNIASANVTNIAVTCFVNLYSICGTVSRPSGGNTVTLRNNAVDDLGVSGASFYFPTLIPDGAPYAVTVSVQPPGQICSVANGKGAVSASNVANISVTCSASASARRVGGAVSGLAAGTSLVLQNNGADDLTLHSTNPAFNYAFNFPTPVAFGAAYSVTVLAPLGQSCSAGNGTGTIVGPNVTNVMVTCATNTLTVGGTVSGLYGALVLRNYGADDLGVSTNGAFTFATTLVNGSSYAVTISTKTTPQTCLLANASGSVAGLDITSVAVKCGLPDLRPVNVTFEQRTGAGNPLVATVGVGNAGTLASAATTATVRLFADAGCATTPRASLSANVGALEPSTVASAVTQLVIVSPGTYPSQSLTVTPTPDDSNTANKTFCQTSSLVVH